MPSRSTDRIIAGCRSWSDFVQCVGKLKTTKQRGDAFERLTQLYLQTDPEYVTKLKSVWLLEQVPVKIRQHLNLPKADEGIDLIAKTHAGGYWAVQSKYRANKSSRLTRTDLATFSQLAFGYCMDIEFGLVAHTSLKGIRKRYLLGNIGERGFDVWAGLSDGQWEQIHRKLDQKPVKLERRKPRKHQRAAIRAAHRHYSVNGAVRGRMIMPCGTGKSLTAFWVAKELGGQKILVAVPSLALIGQSLKDWTREFLAAGQVPDWLCVCSSEDVGKLDKDEFVGQTYDLGVPTTTDVHEIAAFLRKRTTSPRIIFTTYQSGHRVAEAAGSAKYSFDVAIFDEAHKTVGRRGRAFAVLLDEDNLRVKHRVFMTATERVLKGGRSDDVLSMDDVDVYGERFYALSFKQAIADELICDYRILTVTISDTRIRELVANHHFVDADERLEGVDALELAAGLALKRAAKKQRVRHAISFHRSIKSAKRFAAQQDVLNEDRKLGPRMTNLHISSKQSVGDRKEILADFPSYRCSLLTNARCLTEGIDVPEVDCVLFASPKQSTVDIVQAAGRALRRHDGKKLGYILLPLIVPDGMNLDQFTETTEFRQVARTITALSTQDERIAEEFRIIERKEKPSDRIVHVEGDIPIGSEIDLDEFANSVGVKIWERVRRANWRPFEQARAFARSLGFSGGTEWREAATAGRLPRDIPSAPDTVYRGKWTTWGDWIGTGQVSTSKREFRTYAAAQIFARKLGLKNNREWRVWAGSCARPDDINSSPDRYYKGRGWTTWGDFLGIRTLSNWEKEFLPFEEARKFARALGLKGQADWRRYAQSDDRPSNIPSNPNLAYPDSWQGDGDWLGTGRLHSKSFRPFREGRSFARSLGLRSLKDWHTYSKSDERPEDIPSNPNRTYRETGWDGWPDWLGTVDQTEPT